MIDLDAMPSKVRYNVQFNLRENGEEALQALVERTGMVRQELAARVFQWVLRQDDLLQAVILGQIPDRYVEEVLDLIKQAHRREETQDSVGEVLEIEEEPAQSAPRRRQRK